MTRRISFLTLFVAIAVGVIASSVPSASAFVFGPGPSANGHGNTTVNGEKRTFSFSAITRKDGTVTGNVTLHNRSTDTFIHADVDCMQVVGNTATISGTITNSSDETLEGLPGVFSVQDNGEGASASPDLLSLYQIYAAGSMANCTNVNPAMTPIEAGNIQVKP